MIDLYLVLIVVAGIIVFRRWSAGRTGDEQTRRESIAQGLLALGFVAALMMALRLAGGPGPMKLVIVLPLALALTAVSFLVIRKVYRFRARIIACAITILGSRHAGKYASAGLAALVVLCIIAVMAANRAGESEPMSDPSAISTHSVTPAP